MLQWMGGARRKVTAAKRSTHNRQKQYFEQRKRQQQTTGQNNNTDVRNKRTHYDEEPRSLDILSLINLATTAQQYPFSHKHGSELGNISPSKIPQPFDPQDVPAAHKNECKMDGLKIPTYRSEFASNSTDAEPNEQKAKDLNDVSILDLLGDDGPKSSSEGKSINEPHVAFSVEGLGKVGIETPVHSPRLQGRNIPSIPKASKHIRLTEHLKSIPHDLRLDLNTMLNDIKMSQDGSPREWIYNSRGISNGLSNTKNTKFMVPCVSPNACDVLTGKYNDEEIFLACKEGHKEQQWSTRFGILDENFNDEANYDAAWKSKPCHTQDYPFFLSKAKNSEAYDDGFGEPLFQNKRTLFKAHQKSDVSGPSTPYFKHLRPERDYDSVSFDWERSHAGNGSSDFGSVFSQPAWSFLTTEDSQDNMSVLSEESYSCTAEREGRNYGFGSHSGKLKESKINHRDRHHIKSDRKHVMKKFSAVETMYTGLDESPWEENLVGRGNYESMPNQWSPEADYCSTYSSESPGMFEQECISLTREGYTSPKSASAPSSCNRTYMETDTKFFGCKLVTEDNLFDMFPVPEVYPTADFTNKRSKLKIHNDCESSKKFSFKNDILKQMPDPGDFPYLFSAGEPQIQKATQFPDLSRPHKVGEDNIDGHTTLGTPQKGDSLEKKSLSSLNSGTAVVIDCKSNHSVHQESKGETQELFDEATERDPPYEAEKSPVAMEEVPISDHCSDSSPVPSQIEKKESMKEKLKAEKNFSSKGGGNKDTSYQVMLESYVLQLLCVQKVLMEASEKDVKKKR